MKLMKNVIIALLAVTIILIVTIVYDRFFVQSKYGPLIILAVILLVCFSLALAVTLLLYETRLREIVARFWLLTISIGSSFLVLDLVAGALLIKPLSPELSPDRIRHHKLVPNTNSRFEKVDFSYIQHVNNLGLRGEDTDLENPQNHIRILTLGDSFTMGKGVEDNQTFSALLEKSLNEFRAGCDSSSIEVLNGGVDSYTPLLSYLQLTTDLANLNPDMIVLNLDQSDLVQEDAYRKEALIDSDGEIVGVPGDPHRKRHLDERIRDWINQNLYFTRLILFYTNKLFGYKDFSVRGVVEQANPELLKHTLIGDSTDRSEQWKQIFESILRIKGFADNRSIPFVLTVYPWGHQVNENEWAHGRYYFIPKDASVSNKSLETIRDFTNKMGIELVDLFPVFLSYRGEHRLYYDYDMHWTPQGHKVMAGGLDIYIRENHEDLICN